MEEWAFYEPKVERCRRLEGMEDQIKAERLARKIQGQARLNDPSLKDHPFLKIYKKRILNVSQISSHQYISPPWPLFLVI